MKFTYHALVNEAVKAIRAYYIEDAPILSDGEYDELVRQIAAIEKEHPDWLREDSPTRHVGGYAASSFAKVKHPRPMLSLKNAFTKEDLQAFATSADVVGDGPVVYVVEPKLDGLTLVCSYENGALISAVTRGDGLVGEDVTVNAMTLTSVPKVVDYKGNFQVRGEVVMPRTVFTRLNIERTKNGEQPFANPRNAAAGSIRQKNPDVTRNRMLSYCVYDLFGVPDVYTEIGKLKWLEGHGFFSINSISRAAESIDEAWDLCAHAEDLRNSLPVDIDGMVLKVDKLHVQARLGETPVYPRWAIAYKFPQQHQAATLLNVEWQVGRGGSVTPVAVFTPTIIGGSIVTRASLHNPKYVRALGLHIGDTIAIYKAAEIIPQVSSVLRPGTGALVEIPTRCPVCGKALQEGGSEEGMSLMCVNEQCGDRLVNRLAYFASRPCMDILGLGEAAIRQLVEARLVHSPADLYDLTQEQLQTLPRFGKAKAKTLVTAIADSKKRPAVKVLAALGIPEIGPRVAEVLLSEWKSIPSLVSELCLDSGPLLNKLLALPCIGPKKALSVKRGLTCEDTLELVHRLEAVGVQMRSETTQGITMRGQVVCITGTLSQPREVIADLVRANGGTVSAVVGTGTTMLIAGASGGRESSKTKKAKKLHIKIVTEEQFKEML